MPADMGELLGDLADETTELTGLVSGLDQARWLTPTPASGWHIGDQVAHLAFFDDAAVLSATDPDRFAAELGSAVQAGQLSTDDIAERSRTLTGAEVLAWFERSRGRLIEVFCALDPAQRLPWFGPPMSAASSATARIMETWAHGQDVADALGVVRIPTRRLRQVAHLGVRALPFSFAVRGLEPPAEPVRVELTGPDGELWAWGPADAENRVSGQALDFCLVVTQRRHRSDVAIQARGRARGCLA